MDEKKYKLVMASLLHDVGKMVIRANPGKQTHSKASAEFLRKFAPEAQEILRAVEYHHGAELRKLKAEQDDISYIVYEADNIAASTDRRENGEDNSQLFNAEAPLENISNVFLDDGKRTVFPLRGLNQNEKLFYPEDKGTLKAVSADYQKLVAELESNFKRCSPDTMSPNELLQIIEATASYVPSSTAANEAADISLYDHQKLTAAAACCLYDYFMEHNITDYRSYCFGDRVKEIRGTDTYILASGDLSGIQDFIYTIPSEGALKSLRGRSFYLEILLENVVDQLLEELELTRANLLYSGGGNFYVLLPNTQLVQDKLTEVKNKVNRWFLEKWGSSLYLSMGWAECSGDDFKGGEDNRLGKVYKRVREKISRDKHSRYSVEELGMLFDHGSELNRTLDKTKECSICHNSSHELVEYGKDSVACPNCKALRDLGAELLKGDVLAVFDECPADTASVEIPATDGKMYLAVFRLSETDEKCLNARRIYVKNKMYTGRLMATRLWMGDYITKDRYGKTLDFKELVELSGGSADSSGIRRLGILRADVDNLGAAFMAGFTQKYNTLGRTAALSRQLSLFFKCYINHLCAGELPAGQDKFFLFDAKENAERSLHIVYSGGDDMFIAGAWDDVLELAVDLNRAFKKYTNGKMNFSAGLAFLPPGCPIAEMARLAGEMESFAKDNPEKASVVLFGEDTTHDNTGKTSDMARYKWDEFIDGVCGEKLSFFKNNLNFDGGKSGTKVTAGKGVLYRWLELLRDSSNDINLARFAYVLARMEPDKKSPAYQAYERIRKQLYSWYQNEADRKQMETALELVIYKTRQKGDK